MSEQFIKAFRGDAKKLDRVIGSKDEKLAARILAHDLAEDVGELIEESGHALDEVVREIISGKLVKKNAYVYRRALELFASVVLTDLEDEITFPGRGWQDLAPAWKHWGAKTLASHWAGTLGWPWKSNDTEWPIAYVIPGPKLVAIEKELRAIDARTVIDEGVPRGIDRFSDDWSPEDLAPEIENAAQTFAGWCKGKGDLLVWHDGQQ